MFDPKSDYALNKMAPNAIVYMDAAGEETRLTCADFSSLEEFQRWKAWSDENYHDTEKASHVFFTITPAPCTAYPRRPLQCHRRRTP